MSLQDAVTRARHPASHGPYSSGIWIQELVGGRLDDIRTCVGASEGCIGRLRQGKAITCVQNPMIGREAELGVITRARREPSACW